MDIYIKYYYIYTETGTCISSHICIQLARMIIDRLKTEMELKNKDNEKKERKENWNKTEHGFGSFLNTRHKDYKQKQRRWNKVAFEGKLVIKGKKKNKVKCWENFFLKNHKKLDDMIMDGEYDFMVCFWCYIFHFFFLSFLNTIA